MHDVERALHEQQDLAAKRFHAREGEREEKIRALLRPGGIVEADTPERVAQRLDRLVRYRAGEELPLAPADVPDPEFRQVVEAAIDRAPVAVAAAAAPALPEEPEDAAAVVLERIINSEDFVDIRYLEAGVAAARAVCRVNIRNEGGRLAGYGSGSLVSPQLVLTNHHVFPNGRVAAVSAVEFDYQDGIDGQPLRPRLFRLDPERFFLADRERDFALVAVRASEQALGPFGFNRLIEAEGKAVIGEFVTIVQHPRGQKKQVALRENRIVDLLDSYMHYEADTEPGSSGSPVFNDQWEIVALHHASVRARDREEFGGYLNEGIRISRILKHVRAQGLTGDRGALVTGLFESERIVLAAPAPVVDDDGADTGVAPGAVAPIRIPIEVTVRVRAEGAGGAVEDGVDVDEDEGEEEAIRIDPDYGRRRGYNADFLGDGYRVPLPTLPADLLSKTSRKQSSAGGGRHVLTYHHYSVVMDKERRLAFFTAVNVNGRQIHRLRREDDKWFLDPRIPAGEQTGEDVYASNPLDRGHLVRRLDPAWGRTRSFAKRANDDTYHFTNCTPQHRDFNQNRTTWAGLEDYLLYNADNRDFRASIFTGPVLAEDDDEYRGVRLPRQFWKVAVAVRDDGKLSATGYLLSQEELIRGLEVDLEAFSYGAYKTFQVPISRIEDLTRLDFGDLRDHDPLEGQETTEAAVRELASVDDITL